MITGGARSGKSTLAESFARESGMDVFYLATMHYIPGDMEQMSRIERHRRRRPTQWRTVEVKHSMYTDIAGLPSGEAFVLIDCLSLYVSNLLLGPSPEHFDSAGNPYDMETDIRENIDKVLAAIDSRSDFRFTVVTNEVGWGVVPDTPLGRSFRDFLGLVNQRFAEQAQTVWLCCSGLRLRLKPQG